MAEHLYTDHPALYDAIQSEWDYDRDVDFVRSQIDRRGVTGRDLLEVGCGTGEHTCRFERAGFDVTAVDPFEGMLDRARSKCGADFRRDSLPDLDVDGPYEVVVAIRGVINHLQPEELGPAIEALTGVVEADGVIVFDNSNLPPEGNDPGLDVGSTDEGRYVRVAHHEPTGDGTLEWRSVTFTEDGDPVVNTREMTPFADAVIRELLAAAGVTVETHDGFGPEDTRTVFVASPA
jgi:SAM-dependent methyltransferase